MRPPRRRSPELSPGRTSPRRRSAIAPGGHFALALVLGLLALSCSAGDEPPAVVRPASLETLDPEVRGLIALQIEKAEAAPTEAASHGSLGLVYEANLLWDEASRSYAEAARLAPADLGWRLHEAIATRQRGGFDEALELYRSLAADYPTVPAVQQRLGNALLEKGDLEAAETAFRSLVDLVPNAPQGWAGWGDVLIRRGEFDEAARTLERAVELSPGYRMAQYLLGDAYRRLGRLAEAEQALARGVDASVWYLADPLTDELQKYAVNLTSRLDQAGQLLNQGEAEAATEILEKALAGHPGNVTVLNNLSIAYMRSNRMAEAEDLLLAAATIDDERFSTYLNLASLAQRQGRLEEALSYSEKAIERAPRHDQTHFAKGQALARMGRFEEALESLDQARLLNAGKPAYHAFSGDLCLRLDLPEEALAHFRRALELDAGWFPAWIGVGRASLELNRPDEARSAVEEAARLAPGHPALRALELRLAEGSRSEP